LSTSDSDDPFVVHVRVNAAYRNVDGGGEAYGEGGESAWRSLGEVKAGSDHRVAKGVAPYRRTAGPRPEAGIGTIALPPRPTAALRPTGLPTPVT
jgi:hypothetical protein